MNNKQKKNNFSKQALIIGAEELVQINLSNKLSKNFEFQVRNFNDLKMGIDFIIKSEAEVLVIDLDKINTETLERVYELINYTQTPTIFIATDPHDFKLPDEHPFISILSKSIINTMFNESLTLLIEKVNLSKKTYLRLQKVSKGKKPKSFYILATILLLEPLIKFIYMKMSTGLDVDVVVRTIMSIKGIQDNFEFWFMFPIAGIALIIERSWSFLVFAVIQIYCIYSYFTYEAFSWPYVAESPHKSAAFLIMVNFTLILYFLVPENRRPYWNKAQMLWRDTSRFQADLAVHFEHENDTVYSTITNISCSGAYFQASNKMQLGHQLNLLFMLSGKERKISAQIKRAHHFESDNLYGYGLVFNNLTSGDKNLLKDYISQLTIRTQ
jgi:hypothetical protein